MEAVHLAPFANVFILFRKGYNVNCHYTSLILYFFLSENSIYLQKIEIFCQKLVIYQSIFRIMSRKKGEHICQEEEKTFI